jgi:phosphoglycolate phosphatase-like HAD superfamily hydrolase
MRRPGRLPEGLPPRRSRRARRPELKKLVDAKSRQFLEAIRDGVRTYPGVVPLVKALHAADVPLAICSGALRSDIDPILSRSASLAISP